MMIIKTKVNSNLGTSVDLIPKNMWAYKTTIKTTSRYPPPFTLTFGIDALAPVELEWPIARIDNYDEESNVASMLMEHDEREEIREHALLKELEYKRKME